MSFSLATQVCRQRASACSAKVLPAAHNQGMPRTRLLWLMTLRSPYTAFTIVPRSFRV